MNLKLSQPEKSPIEKALKTRLMGVLNVTPDSFSDGGLFFDEKKAVERGVEIERDGASIVDVGGESTRPNAKPISTSEELKRVIPVIEALARRLKIPISIDTSKPEVAREAIRAGASMINNIMGVNLDREMAVVAAEFDVPIVLMHIRGEPRTMQKAPVYENLIGEIISELKESIAVAEGIGVDPQKIIIDPGIGFGKTVLHNIEILKRLKELKVLDKPILIGPSRKSFIGIMLNIEKPGQRLMGTAAAVAIAIINGADIIRVHDVKEMLQVSALTDGVTKGQWS